MRTYRKENDVKYELDNITKQFNSSKSYLIISIISEIIFGFLYMFFVYKNGTIFDNILSFCVLTFFVIVAILNMIVMRTSYKKIKPLKHELKIARETPEERLARERSEKLERILN
jgi:EamA domain-containing membrane protein RarD